MWPSGYRRISAKDITPVRFWAWPPIKKGEKMPVRKVGRNKYQYGTTGKVYSSKKKAQKQGLAIRLSQLKRGKKVK